MASVSKMQGTPAFIEKVYDYGKNISCNMCVFADLDDHSCRKKPYVLTAREDGVGNWKKCEYFKLGPEYNTDENRKKVEKVKGSEYYTKKKTQNKKNKEKKEIIKKKDFQQINQQNNEKDI